MPERADVVVIGSGLAGLAAALELQAQGRDVLLLEQGGRLGGKADSGLTPAGQFPNGPTSFNGRQAVFWRLLKLLGIDEVARLSPSSDDRFVVRDGRLAPLKPNPFSVLTTPALTLGDKLRLAYEFVSTRKTPPAGTDESLDTFLERRFGRPLVDHFFAAVLSGIFAGDLKQLSAASCMPALVNAEKEYGSVLRGALKTMGTPADGTRPGLYTFAEGFQVLGTRAAEKLPHLLHTRVTRVGTAQGLVQLELHRQGRPGSMEARQVVIATEATGTSRLLRESLPAAARVLSGFKYAPLALVQWSEAFPGQSKLPLGFGYLTPPIEQGFALGTLFVGDLLGESPRRFSTFIGGGAMPERAGLSDEALIEGARIDLQRLVGGTLGPVQRVVRWPEAVFQPPVGHAQRLSELEQALAGSPVTLAGSYFGGAAMKDALASGFAAATRVQASAAALAGAVAPELRV
jgi:oxygen-dependent protoporphyrinogen oxidase